MSAKTNYHDMLVKLDGAQRVTSALVGRTNALAKMVRDKMEELGVSVLMGGKYIYDSVSCNQYNDITSLLMRVTVSNGNGWDECEYSSGTITVALDVDSVSPIREKRAFYPRELYSDTYRLPSRDDLMTFIADLPQLIEELAELATEESFPAIPELA